MYVCCMPVMIYHKTFNIRNFQKHLFKWSNVIFYVPLYKSACFEEFEQWYIIALHKRPTFSKFYWRIVKFSSMEKSSPVLQTRDTMKTVCQKR